MKYIEKLGMLQVLFPKEYSILSAVIAFYYQVLQTQCN